jgi:hypothetical protein
MNRDEIVEQICGLIEVRVFKDYREFSENETMKLMKKRLDFDNDYLLGFQSFPILDENEFIVYTKDLLNNKAVVRPSRTKSCKHIETLSLKVLIDSVLNYNNCTLCESSADISITIDSIYVDKTFEDIMNKGEVCSSNYIILNKNNIAYRIYDETTYAEAIRYSESESSVYENLIKMNKNINTGMHEGRIFDEFLNIFNIFLNK